MWLKECMYEYMKNKQKEWPPATKSTVQSLPAEVHRAKSACQSPSAEIAGQSRRPKSPAEVAGQSCRPKSQAEVAGRSRRPKSPTKVADQSRQPMFCRRLYFVGAYILWTPIFWRRQYLVDACILLKPIFCQQQYFIDANILLTPNRKLHVGLVGELVQFALIFIKVFQD